MVVAKTDRAHRALAAQFADHGRTGPLRRGYLAFVWGAPDRPKGTIDKPIDRHPHARDKMAVRAGRPRGDHPLGGAGALSRAPTASRSPACSPAGWKPAAPTRSGSIWPHIGHPLLGDAVYGAGLQDQGRPPAAGGRGPRWRPLEDRPCMPIYWLSNIRSRGRMLEFRSELPADLARLRHVSASSARGTQADRKGIVKSKA